MLELKILMIFIIVLSLSFSGIFIFMKGFLLSRSVTENKSECLVDFALRAEDNHSHHSKGCWMHSRFKKAIIVLIDALKYDFMEYNESLNLDLNAKETYYKNNLPLLQKLITKKPFNSRLYRFIADPPTTTMQRLKGLTTGSLPTFIDAGSNFQSYEITEDNFIDQLIKQGKRIKFFGDDTWLGLFPNKFHTAYGFPSFNIKDLHSVDDGIIANIYPEVKKSDWDVIITHFLGVDHCGHRYGPNFPAMRDKLSQMNEFLSNITDLMKEDTILFVMGDHGMTSTGDHGGDSIAELEAGLFIYSPSIIASSSQVENNTIRQVDFTPTFSLLLGLPIPFSNLGMVITDLFTHCPWWNTASNEIRQAYHKIKALRLNAYQINNYLSTYKNLASDLPLKELRNLQYLFTQTELEIQNYVTLMVKNGLNSDIIPKFHSLQNKYEDYLKGARQLCENIWAKFDLQSMCLGIITLMLGVSQSFYFFMSWINDDVSLPTSAKMLLGGTVVYLISLCVHLLIFSSAVPLMPATLALVLILSNCFCAKHSIVNSQLLKKTLTFENIISSLLVVMNCGIYFSNSFTINEDGISMFLLQSLVCVLSVRILCSKWMTGKENSKNDITRPAKKSKVHFDIMHVILDPKFVCFMTCLLCCVFIRISSIFLSCREEQISCENSIFSQPLATLESGMKNKRYIFSVVCLLILVCVSRQWLKHFGNLNGTSPGVLSMLYGPPLAALFICLHWALQGLPVSDTLTLWQQALMARSVYFLIVASLLTFTLWPLLVFVLPSRSSLHFPYKANLQILIPTIYNQLKLKENSNDDNEKAPVVYGLGSAYSAGIIGYLNLFSLLLTLLLNDGIAPSIMFAVLILYLCLELCTAYTICCNQEDLTCAPSWVGLILFNFLSTVLFYTTGHQATFPSIRYEAGYIGFYGDFNSYILPGFLIWLNTFAGPIFISLAGPLVIFWPLLSSGLASLMVNRRLNLSKGKMWQGDFSLFDNGIRIRKNMFHLVCGTFFLTSLKVLSAALAATIHRRHLMVWKIFAPRLVYESAIFVTVSSAMIIGYLLVLRIDRAMMRFVKKIHQVKDS